VLTNSGQIGERSVGLVNLMRDVLDEERGGLKPLSALLLATAVILGGLITYNAMFLQHPESTRQQVAEVSGQNGVKGDANVSDNANTIIIKYDPVVEDVQRALLATGIYRGLVDGVNGQRTKLAVQQYQQANGLPVNGEVSKELATHVQYTNKLKAASEFTGSVEPVADTQTIPSLINPKPDVQTANENDKVELPANNITKNVSLVPAINSKIARMKRVQIALASMGYKAGKVTGSLNEDTKSAILKFEMDNGLAMDGVVDAKLLEALQITANN
jgi:peptidoglycan hydrolase-like protein with peptidoglycan-binding domain